MEPSDLESRITALDEQVRDLNDRVRESPASVLARAAERDLSEFRGEPRDFR